MEEPGRGKYHVRFAEGPQDIRAALALRARAFRGRAADAEAERLDADRFDDEAEHVLVEEAIGGRLSCCFRLMRFADGSQLGRSYSAQFYDLSSLANFPGPMLELGRFCIAESTRDADVLRRAWQMLAAYVDGHGIKLIFGCSSFRGTEPEPYLDAFALLRARHLAPECWMPGAKALEIFPFASALGSRNPDPKSAMRSMPPLLRSYLAMGAWVSDHAVINHDLDTLHVFTGLEIRAVPEARARTLRGGG